MTVPPPTTTRVPRSPYTMIASCGPALRNSLAKIVRMKNTANSAKPITTAFSVSIQWSSPLTPESGLNVTAQFVPRTDVSDALLISRDYDFGALRNRDAGFGAGAGYPARAGLRIDQLPGAARADRDAQTAEHADHFVVFIVQFLFMLHQYPGQEQEHDRCPAKPAHRRYDQRQPEPQRRVLHQQIPGAAEPGKERR